MLCYVTLRYVTLRYVMLNSGIPKQIGAGLELGTSGLRVQRANQSATLPPYGRLNCL